MLQTIRDKITGWFAYVFLGAIAIVFIFWGVQMRSETGRTTYAAKVNGDRISIDSVTRAWQDRQQQLQQMFRGEIPESIKKAQQEAVLDEHIRTQLLSAHAADLGYQVSNDQLRETIAGFPQLQVDGKFSPERYRFLLRQQGRNEAQFESELRASLRINELQNAVAGTAFVTPAELQRRQALEGEQREIDYAVVPASSYLATVSVADADIEKWYESHKSEYLTPETVDLEYLDLRLADVAKDVEVSDQALREFYEQNKERLTVPERRRARHILINIGEGTDDAAAKKKAEEVLAKVKAGGDFAALAKQYSQDTVSAAKGGDLDWAAKGTFVGPFEDALFGMNVGEVRGPVQTQFGYHIIKLDAVEGGATKSFEEAREELTRDYKTEKAQALFYERAQKMGDDTFNALNELESTAKKMGLTVQKVSGFTRQGAGDLTDPKVADAVFTTDSLEKKQNSSVISVGDDRAVVLRVTDHHPPEQKPIAQVRTAIEMQLKTQAAKEAAEKRGRELLTKVEGGADWAKTVGEFKLTAFGKKTATRAENALPQSVRQSAFAIPRSAVSADKPAYRGATTEDGSYAVVRVSEIRPGALMTGTPEAAAAQRQATQAFGNTDFSAYVADVESRAKIERNPKVFE